MRYRTSILISTLFLSVFGIVMIYSASSYSAELHFGDGFFYVKKQALAFGAGLVVLLLGYRMKVEWLNRSKWIIYAFAMGLLLILFIPGVGMESYGATRWLNLGFITFQPSELAKFALVILYAGYLDKRPPLRFRDFIVPVLTGLAMCVAVMLEPNMSITMCIAFTMLIMLFVGGMSWQYFGSMAIAGGVAVPALILIEPYRLKRLMAFLDPWANPRAEGYQLIQSYYALGSGGLFGVGLFASRQKYLFLPFAESDFIFSVIGEELGLLGSVFILGVFFVLIYSGIMIAVRANSRFHSLLATGISAVIGVQTLVNIAVVSGSIPPTGLPLPYISAGGSSLMVFMFASGILMNVDRITERDGKGIFLNRPKNERKKRKILSVAPSK